MSVFQDYVQVSSSGYCDILDITRDVESILPESGISNGIVTVFVPGATGAITTIEYESGVLKDLKKCQKLLLLE